MTVQLWKKIKKDAYVHWSLIIMGQSYIDDLGSPLYKTARGPLMQLPSFNMYVLYISLNTILHSLISILRALGYLDRKNKWQQLYPLFEVSMCSVPNALMLLNNHYLSIWFQYWNENIQMKYIKRDYSEIHPGHNWDRVLENRALYSKM